MPQLFKQRIRIMTIYGWLEPIGILLGMFFGGMFLLTYFVTFTFEIVTAMALLGLASIGIVIALDQHIKRLRRESDLSPYEIPIHAPDFERVSAMLTAQQIDADGAVSFRTRDGFSVRLLVQHCPEFEQTECSRRRKALNKRINLRFPSPAEGPFFEVMKRMRINLLVCGKRSDAAVSWVVGNSEQLLHRNEAIINAVLCLEEQVLIFPACLNSLSLAEVRKYRASAALLSGNLSRSVEI